MLARSALQDTAFVFNKTGKIASRLGSYRHGSLENREMITNRNSQSKMINENT